MKVGLLHFSDLHISSNKDYSRIDFESRLDFINDKIFDDITDFVLIISGDLSASGKYEEYTFIGKMIDSLKNRIREKCNKDLRIIATPGNHDLFFSQQEYNELKKKTSFDCDYINDENDETLRFNNYKNFCNSYRIPFGDYVRNCSVPFLDEFSIEFVLINSSYYSRFNNVDYGKHFIPSEYLRQIGKPTLADVKIGVIHHTLPWFEPETKMSLSNMIKDNIQVMFIGHEHNFEIQDSKSKKEGFEVINVNGGAFYEKANNSSVFNACILDSNSGLFTVYKANWNNIRKIYEFSKIEAKNINLSKGNKNFIISPEKRKELYNVVENRNIDTFYIFPTVKQYIKSRNGKYKDVEIGEAAKFLEIICNKKIVEISGKSHNGKTALAKYLFSYYYKKTIKCPLIMDALDFQDKEKIEKWEKNTIISFYGSDKYTEYDRLSSEKKILIIDNFHLIKKSDSVCDFIKELLKRYSQIIIIQDKKNEGSLSDELNAIVDADDEKVSFEILSLKPKQRKELIYKVCHNEKLYASESNILTITNDIEMFLRSQPSFIKFDPVLIMKLASKYINSDDRSKIDVFHDVFSKSLDDNVKMGFPDDELLGETLLSSIAFKLYCMKEYPFKRSVIEEVIDSYNDQYGDKLDYDDIYSKILKTGIIKKSIENKLIFESNNHLSYYIAKEVQRLKNEEKDFKIYEELIKDISTGINGDIILYLSLLDNDVNEGFKILNASKSNLNNVELLKTTDLYSSNISIKVIDDQETEDKRHANEERKNEKHEEKELIELEKVNFFSPEERTPEQQQISNAFSYLELNCKLFSNFYRRLKKDKKSEVLEVLYSQCNQILYLVIKPFVDDFDEIKSNVVSYIIENDPEMSKEKAEKILDDLFIYMEYSTILGVYNTVSIYSSSKKNIDSLINYDYDTTNELLKILNLFFIQRKNDKEFFYDKVKEYYRNTKNTIIKNLIRGLFNKYLIFNKKKIEDEEKSVISVLKMNLKEIIVDSYQKE